MCVCVCVCLPFAPDKGCIGRHSFVFATNQFRNTL